MIVEPLETWAGREEVIIVDSPGTEEKVKKNQAMKKVLFHFYFNVVGFIIAQGQCSSHDPQGNRIV